jgi:hypothetical protein
VLGATISTYANQRIEFVKNTAAAYNVSCVRAVTELPYTTAAATQIALSDDATALAAFPTGTTFSYYGVPYTGVCVPRSVSLTPTPRACSASLLSVANRTKRDSWGR